MSADRVDKLRGLLARVQRNATLPRPARVVAAAAPAPAEEFVEDEVTIEEPVLMAEPEVIAPEVIEAEVIAPAAEQMDEAPAIEMSGEAEVMEDLELLDGDIVDITDEPPPVAELPPEPEPAFAEEPPASSRRPIAAASMDEALAGAAEQLDLEGREIPLKTPPPESGPQAAPPMQAMGAPAIPRDLGSGDDVDDLLAGDTGMLDVPTAEQLGGTIDLEDTVSGVIEIDTEERRAHEPIAQPRRPTPVPVAPLAPEATARPLVPADSAPAAFSSRQPFKPEDFAQLLDASLSL